MKKKSLTVFVSTLFLFFLSAAQASQSFVGLIGADYNPNHYGTNGNVFNDHDVFYVGGGATPHTNVYAELQQLKAAGITTVRSYQTYEYPWSEMINDAKLLEMKVIYEAAIGPASGIATANTVLSNVMNTVGKTTFDDTVILVYSGHENYDNTNAAYIISAEQALQKTLAATGVPVTDAFVSGNLVTPPPGDDIANILKYSSPSAPASFDPYPFQWGVAVADAVTSGSTQNSIQYDYNAIAANGIAGSRSVFMAESGWASGGTNPNVPDCGTPGHPNCTYACGSTGYPACDASETSEAAYLTALYAFIRNTSNNAGGMAFEAYDEPLKTPIGSMEKVIMEFLIQIAR